MEMTYPPNFTYSDLNQIISNIYLVRKPDSWEELRERSVDLGDLDDNTLKSIFKLPVFNVTKFSDAFNESDAKIEGYDIYYDDITVNNHIFYQELKIPYQVFIIRFQMGNLDCGLFVDTQGYEYMRYVSLIKEFGEMYDYYKKDLEIRNAN